MYKFKQETHCLGNVPSILPSPFQVSYEAWRLLPLAFKRLARILLYNSWKTMNWRLWGTAFREFSAEPRYVDYAETASLQPARTRVQLSACACADRASGAVHGVDQINKTPQQPGSVLTCTYGPPFTIYTECCQSTCCGSYLRVCAPSLTIY